MILEVATLPVVPGRESEFEAAFAEAREIVAASAGFLGLELQRCHEVPSQYVLLIRWASIEDHTIGFRQSAPYQRWKALLHHFYDPAPTVAHYTVVTTATA